MSDDPEEEKRLNEILQQKAREEEKQRQQEVVEDVDIHAIIQRKREEPDLALSTFNFEETDFEEVIFEGDLPCNKFRSQRE